MADIELVIKIPEEDWEFLKEADGCRYNSTIIEGVINGTPLPKGHGRIVDIGRYEGKVIASRQYCGVNKLIEVAELDTIIEADRSLEDGNDD